MRSFAGRAFLIVALGWASAASAPVSLAQSAGPQPAASVSPGVSPFPGVPTPSAMPTAYPAPPSNGEPDIRTNPEPSFEPPIESNGHRPAAPLLRGPSASPGRGLPSPASSASAAGRFHLHRPGTDVDGDLLTGSLASEAYILKGNVTLHSDPAIDREVADASESTLPLTVTADEIDVDRAELSYIARGHVHFTQGTRSGSSDVAVLNEQRHTLDLIGNADVRDGDHRTTAAKLHYDTASKAFLGAGEVRIYAPLPTPNPSASATPPPKHRHRLPL